MAFIELYVIKNLRVARLFQGWISDHPDYWAPDDCGVDWLPDCLALITRQRQEPRRRNGREVPTWNGIRNECAPCFCYIASMINSELLIILLHNGHKWRSPRWEPMCILHSQAAQPHIRSNSHRLGCLRHLALDSVQGIRLYGDCLHLSRRLWVLPRTDCMDSKEVNRQVKNEIMVDWSVTGLWCASCSWVSWPSPSSASLSSSQSSTTLSTKRIVSPEVTQLVDEVTELEKYYNIVIYYVLGSLLAIFLMIALTHCYITSVKNRNFAYDYKILDEDGRKLTVDEKVQRDSEKVKAKYDQKREEMYQKYSGYKDYKLGQTGWLFVFRCWFRDTCSGCQIWMQVDISTTASTCSGSGSSGIWIATHSNDASYWFHSVRPARPDANSWLYTYWYGSSFLEHVPWTVWYRYATVTAGWRNSSCWYASLPDTHLLGRIVILSYFHYFLYPWLIYSALIFSSFASVDILSDIPLCLRYSSPHVTSRQRSFHIRSFLSTDLEPHTDLWHRVRHGIWSSYNCAVQSWLA